FLLDVRPELTQHHGTVHGGVIGTMADNACAYAAATVAGDVVTSTYTIKFLAPARGARLRALGAVLKPGRRSVVTEARIFAEDEGAPAKLVAVALATIAPIGSAA
ncbi:MAG TPA: PaaI family thioesterase, partial [Paracoccaceae bacterium]|nr:PaaI family thioesterase [Paracoccaceae bacterium]